MTSSIIYSFTVVFPQPGEAIVRTFQLACNKGEAHAIVMPNVTDMLISRLPGLVEDAPLRTRIRMAGRSARPTPPRKVCPPRRSPMRGFLEFKGQSTRLDYDRERAEFFAKAEPHPFMLRKLATEIEAEPNDGDRTKPARRRRC